MTLARACLLPVMLSLALGGCSLFRPSEAAHGTPLRSCEDTADADPRVHDFWATTSSTANPNSFNAEYQAARAKVVNECMRLRSGRPLGGVEKPIP